MMDVGVEPTTQKTHGLSTTPFVKVSSGVLVRLTTCKRLTNSLPKLSLITIMIVVLACSFVFTLTQVTSVAPYAGDLNELYTFGGRYGLPR